VTIYTFYPLLRLSHLFLSNDKVEEILYSYVRIHNFGGYT
jgi:hypothetical protein